MLAKTVLGVVVALSLAAHATAAEFVAPSIVTGAGAGGGPHVRGWNASGGALPVSFHAYSGK